MPDRTVDVAVKYAIDVTEKGLKQAVALGRDLGTTSTKAGGQVDAAMKSINASYAALEKVATGADAKVARSAIDCATTVNKALDDEIAKRREAGSSYAAIIAHQDELKVSSASLAAAIKRDSAAQIAAMQATRVEALKAVVPTGGRIQTALRRIPGVPSASIATSTASREVHSAERGGLRALLPGSIGLGSTALLGAIAGYGSVKGIESSVDSTVERQNVAAQLKLAGLSNAERQTLAASTSALGLAPTAAPQALRALAKQTSGALGDTASGKPNQAAEQAFTTLGISQKALKASGGDLYKTLGLVADALQKGKGGAAEYSAASTVLGRGFASLNPLLKEGSAGLKEQAEWAEKYGLIAKGSGAAGLAKLHSEQVELKFATMGLQQSIAENLTPALLAVLPVFGSVAHVVASNLKPAINDVKAVLGPVVSFFKSGSTTATVLKSVIIALATGFVTYKLAVTGVRVATEAWVAVQTVIDALLTANPIGLVVVALAGLAAGIIYAYNHSKAFRQVVGDVFDWLKGAVTDTIGFVSKHWQLIVEVILGPIGLIVAGVRKWGGDVVGAFESVPAAIGSVFSGLGDIIGSAFAGALNIAIDLVNRGIDAINAVSGAIPFGLGPAKLDHIASVTVGGSTAAPKGGVAAPDAKSGQGRFAAGGLVGAMFSPGEQLIYGGMTATVPGARVAADNVFGMVPAGTAVLTDHGQAMMTMGASLGDALAGQMPHFAAGGTVTNSLGYTFTAPKAKTPAGGKATPRYINHKLIGSFTEADWQAYQLAHPSAKTTAAKGLAVTGPVSTFGPPTEAAGPTAYGGSSSAAGIAINPHGGSGWNDALANSLAGKLFNVSIGAHSAVLKVIDKGPSAKGSHGNRLIDVTGAGAELMGLNPATFPTDTIGKAIEVVGGAAKATTKSAAPTLSNAVASLTARGAFGAGYQQGLTGQGLFNPDLTSQTGVLSSLISDAAVNVQQASTAVAAATTSTSSASGTPTGTPAGLATFDGKKVAKWIIPWLQYGEGKGWHGSVTSGYRSYAAQAAIYNSGVRPAAKPGQSNHQGTAYPSGAVDVTQAAVLGRILSAAHSPLVWAGAKDPVHFSHPHNGSYRRGGLVRGYASGGKVAPSYTQSYYRGRFGENYRGFYLWGKYGRGVPSSAQGAGGHLYKDLSTATMSDAWNAYQGLPQQAGAAFPRGTNYGMLDGWWNKWSAGKSYGAGGVVGAASVLSGVGGRVTRAAASPLGSVSRIVDQSDATDVSGLLTAFSQQLDKATVGSLQQLLSTLKQHSTKGLDAIQVRRLDTALNAVTAAIGNRVGLAVQGAQDQVDKIARDKAHVQNVLTGAGIDPSSSAGLALITATDKATVTGFNSQIGTLNSALATAKKLGDKATIKDLTDKLNTALGNLDSATAQVLVDWRQGIEQAAQDAVDSATQGVNVAQAGEQILGLQQQLAGTDQTPGGGQQIAAYIRSTVLPALAAELAAQQGDQAAAASVGDAARVNSDILAELQTQTSILSESKTAQDAIKQNTDQLKTQGGSLAVQYQGETVTDRISSLLVGG